MRIHDAHAPSWPVSKHRGWRPSAPLSFSGSGRPQSPNCERVNGSPPVG
jgi:hypothetical protein